jgi:chromosome segregation ATPase
MVEMSIELDARRVELAEENANWRQLTANSDLTESLAAGLDEMRAKHAGMVADLPKAVADHAATERACDVAQRRRNTVIGRIARAAPGRLSSALGLLLDSEDRRYRVAQTTMTRAKQTLDQARWDIECLASDIAQVEAALTPPSPQLMEATKRPQPAEIETDDIVMPTRAA